MTTEEKKTLHHFIKEYDDIRLNIDLMQKSIQGLVEKRERLFSKAEELKNKEQSFMATLITKYGESEVTPNKLIQALNND